MNAPATASTTHALRGPQQSGADRSVGPAAAAISPFHAFHEGAQP